MKEPVAAPDLKKFDAVQSTAFKSKGGARRIATAARYSMQGLQAAWTHEASFRQEVGLGILLMAASLWLAPSLVFTVLMNGSVLLVWCAELLNSAIEAIADAVSIEYHPLLGRAKDLGSAAILISLLIVALVWGAALYVRFIA